jgi:NDP-sugar pyrophosphorylase family protein
MNVLIPCAGLGSRFKEAGYTFPKPLIEVKGKAMIHLVTDCLNLQGNFIFIVNSQHCKDYNLRDFLPRIVGEGNTCTVIEVDKLTEGAACTTLLAKDLINTEEELIIANSDQYIEWNSKGFLQVVRDFGFDGAILTFHANHPKWSYAKVDEETGLVTEVAEKKPISNRATVGVYYWKSGADYVKYAEQMINKNIRTNGEFYVCPVFNEAIQDNKNITTFDISKMWGLGTPEDLNTYLNK